MSRRTPPSSSRRRTRIVAAAGRFAVDQLEGRRLLSAAGLAAAALTPAVQARPADSMPSYVVTLVDYPNQFGPVAAGTTEDVSVTVNPFDDIGATTPTGSVVVGWNGGPQYTVPITPTPTGTGIGEATLPLVFAPAPPARRSPPAMTGAGTSSRPTTPVATTPPPAR